MFNLFTVDVEDYPALFFRDLLGQEAPVSERVVESTRRILDLLESTNTSATFFCLGSVALRHPHLIREIHDRGGEIASHGMHHIPFHGLKLEQIREDLTSAKSVLEDILGEPVHGFRVQSSRYVTFQMAEVAVSKDLFAEILSRIERLRCCSA